MSGLSGQSFVVQYCHCMPHLLCAEWALFSIKLPAYSRQLASAGRLCPLVSIPQRADATCPVMPKLLTCCAAKQEAQMAEAHSRASGLKKQLGVAHVRCAHLCKILQCCFMSSTAE